MTKLRRAHIGWLALLIVAAGCLLATAGCGQSNASVGGSAHLPVYHQAPGAPSPADQAASSMARRQNGVPRGQ